MRVEDEVGVEDWGLMVEGLDECHEATLTSGWSRRRWRNLETCKQLIVVGFSLGVP